jgi:hypothetical protein
MSAISTPVERTPASTARATVLGNVVMAWATDVDIQDLSHRQTEIAADLSAQTALDSLVIPVIFTGLRASGPQRPSPVWSSCC